MYKFIFAFLILAIFFIIQFSFAQGAIAEVYLCNDTGCLTDPPTSPPAWRKTTKSIWSICDVTPSAEDSEPDGDKICGEVGSIRIYGPYDVRLYNEKNYEGERICFSAAGGYELDDYEIAPANGWNKDTDSVEILADGECINPGQTVAPPDPPTLFYPWKDAKGIKLTPGRLVDSAALGGNLICNPGEVVCGAQNLAGSNDKLDMIWCCPTDASVNYDQKRLVDSGEAGDGTEEKGNLLCDPNKNEVVCGAQNLIGSNDKLDMIWCCPTDAKVNYGRKRRVDSAVAGGNLFCYPDEVVCGAQNLAGSNDKLDMIWCCPSKPAVNYTLTFEWKAPKVTWPKVSPEVYHLQYRKDGENYGAAIAVAYGTSTSLTADSFKPMAKYFWQVRSCADLNGNGEIDSNECSPYSDEWSFEYSLLAPENFEIISYVYPITFEWDEAPGAKSYVLTPRLRTKDCEWYRIDCWINTAIKSLINKVKEFLSFRDYDPTCPWTLWEKNLNKCLSIPIPVKEDVPSNQYIDTTCLFVENVKEIGLGYTVTIASCFDERNQQCGPLFYYDDEGKEVHGTNPLLFYTDNFPPLPPPILQEPLYDPAQPIPVIGRKHALRWYTDIENEPLGQCANFVRLRIDGPVTIDEEIPNTVSLWFEHELLDDLFEDAAILDSVYNWRVRPCWQLLEGDTRCEANVWSEEWRFKTIGAPPLLLKPGHEVTVKIPVTLEWKDIDGAGSYYYQVATTSNFADTDIIKNGSTTSPLVPINYPEIKPNTWYYWRVKTCADEEGKVCGENWSASRSFKTHPVNPPEKLRPAIGKIPTSLEWDADPGAHFYQYMMKYTTTTYDYDKDGNPIKETLEECEGKVGTQLISPTITPSTNLWLGEICLGKYNWRVRSCLEETCDNNTTDYTSKDPPIVSDWREATYIASEITTPPEKGIVPCGRRTNIRGTPYDEREPCELKHLGFMLQNILDFLLWRLSFVILIVLGAATGVMFYFSLGAPDTIIKVKSFWRAAGTGFAIIFLAWIFINLLLVIFGYQVKFFGQWWQLPL